MLRARGVNVEDMGESLLETLKKMIAEKDGEPSKSIAESDDQTDLSVLNKKSPDRQQLGPPPPATVRQVE